MSKIHSFETVQTAIADNYSDSIFTTAAIKALVSESVSDRELGRVLSALVEAEEIVKIKRGTYQLKSSVVHTSSATDTIKIKESSKLDDCNSYIISLFTEDESITKAEIADLVGKRFAPRLVTESLNSLIEKNKILRVKRGVFKKTVLLPKSFDIYELQKILDIKACPKLFACADIVRSLFRHKIVSYELVESVVSRLHHRKVVTRAIELLIEKKILTRVSKETYTFSYLN